LAVETFRTLELAGLARVDFFLSRADGGLYVNEVNTLPGFTAVSMYPKMWEASGLSQKELLSRLVDLALQRWKARRTIDTGRAALPRP
jgi:D-alanine-D-alanine ligase